MSRVPRLPILIAVILASLAVSASAQAQVTIGQLAPSGTEFSCSPPHPYDEWQASVSAGAGYAVPAPGGVITSWSTNAGTAMTQRMAFKVFRPASGGAYTVVGLDGEGTRRLTPSILNTFAVDIPVQTGDIIGINVPPLSRAACFFSGAAGDEIAYREGSAAVDSSITPETLEAGFRVNVSATLLPPPAVSAISPASGPIKGGTSVVVTGANFAEVKSVSFGSAPATSFNVDSESQITAVVPASAKVTATPIIVTTVAGAATSPTRFTYQGCVVPKLNGKKLKAVKKKLKKADCKLGKVTKKKGATTKSGKVQKQSPKAGRVLAPGSKVKVTLKA